MEFTIRAAFKCFHSPFIPFQGDAVFGELEDFSCAAFAELLGGHLVLEGEVHRALPCGMYQREFADADGFIVVEQLGPDFLLLGEQGQAGAAVDSIRVLVEDFDTPAIPFQDDAIIGIFDDIGGIAAS